MSVVQVSLTLSLQSSPVFSQVPDTDQSVSVKRDGESGTQRERERDGDRQMNTVTWRETVRESETAFFLSL